MWFLTFASVYMNIWHGLHGHLVQRYRVIFLFRDIWVAWSPVICTIGPTSHACCFPGLDHSWQLVPCGPHCPSTRPVNHSLKLLYSSLLTIHQISISIPLKDPIWPLNSPPSSPAMNNGPASFTVSFRPPPASLVSIDF